MEKSHIEIWENKDKDYLVAHYREVGDESKLYDRLIWEVPSIAIVIISALLVAAYAYAPNLLLCTFFTFLATIWAFSMIVFATKHQYFVRIQKKRLMILEEKCFGILNLQRFADPDESQDLKLEKAHWEKPKGLQHFSAQFTLNIILWIMFLGLLSLTIYNAVNL